MRQPRSWFGYTYGDPDDSVRAEWVHFFIRQYWGSSSTLRLDADLGTGPMWSNRRIPAATSKLNFNSQLGLGVALLPQRQDAAVHRLSLLSHLQRRLHWPQPRLELERILRRDAREVTPTARATPRVVGSQLSVVGRLGRDGRDTRRAAN